MDRSPKDISQTIQLPFANQSPYLGQEMSKQSAINKDSNEYEVWHLQFMQASNCVRKIFLANVVSLIKD